jgi:hypothetical protein
MDAEPHNNATGEFRVRFAMYASGGHLSGSLEKAYKKPPLGSGGWKTKT